MEQVHETDVHRHTPDPAAGNALRDQLETFATRLREVVVGEALGVGGVAPTFQLPDAFGAATDLATLLTRGPVVLRFYDGDWCPHCNGALAPFKPLLPKFLAHGATFVAITARPPNSAYTEEEKHALPFPVLTDADQAVAALFGLRQPLPDGFAIGLNSIYVPLEQRADGWFLPHVGATYLIESDRTIAWANVFTQDSDPREIITWLAANHVDLSH